MPDTPATSPTAAATAGMLGALRRLLRPLVRLLLARGVTYPMLQDLLKDLYVDVAHRDFAIEGKRQTDSRLSLLTGVHRKDVRRLRETDLYPDAAPPQAVPLGVRLVALWSSDPRFLDAEQRPLALPRLGRGTDEASFEGLVQSLSKDIRPRAVLDELLRLGVLRLAGDDRVELHLEAFVPRAGFDEKAYFLGRNVGDHLAVAVDNLLDRRPPGFERAASYDALTAASIEELRELAEKSGMQALKTVNRRAMALEQRDAGKPDARRRFSFGAYFHDADKDE